MTKKQDDETSYYDGVRVFPDGDMKCAVFDDFVNIQESFCGFGKTDIDAIVELAKDARIGK